MDTLHSLLLYAHSFVRWVVLVFGLLAVAYGLRGSFGSRPWAPADARYGRWFATSMDVQALLGLVLYFTADWFRHAFDMSEPVPTRFFATEHVIVMLVALVVVHLGVVVMRRTASDVCKFRRSTILFGLALLAILAATPWPWTEYGRELIRLPGLG
ncbi:MAG: hypothetical protein ACK2T6_01445 [Anaerolineae bacterium]